MPKRPKPKSIDEREYAPGNQNTYTMRDCADIKEGRKMLQASLHKRKIKRIITEDFGNYTYICVFEVA